MDALFVIIEVNKSEIINGDISLIKRAIITVSDKTGLTRLVEELAKNNVEFITTSETTDYVEKIGYDVNRVSDFIGMPEMPKGLVKTMHPKIHGGILGNIKNSDEKIYMDRYGIKKFDLVIVNFHPLKNIEHGTILDLKNIADEIDIGGPALARSAAKAALLHGKVTVLTSPKQYELFLKEIKKSGGDTSLEFKLMMAAQAFASTYNYERVIQEHFALALKNLT